MIARADHRAVEGIRIDAICPAIIDTEMMARSIGGSDEDGAAVFSVGSARR